jgi:hypothetical protein
MKSTKFIFLLLLIVIFIASCKSHGAQERTALYMDNVAAGSIPPPPPPASGKEMAMNQSVSSPNLRPETPIANVTRKIIKDGRMEIKVKKLEQGKVEIDSLVNKFHGYYAEETFTNQDYTHDFSLSIRIPSEKFESFIARVESGIGELVFKNVSSRDVTEEFIDLETRLKNKRNYLNRYGELLKQAKSVKDILEIEEKTRLIEEEIESTEGRLKYLNNQVDFSTLVLRITKKNEYSFKSGNEGNFFDRLKLSLVRGWFGLVTFTLFVIRIWPFWIIVSLLYYLIAKILRRRKLKRSLGA